MKKNNTEKKQAKIKKATATSIKKLEKMTTEQKLALLEELLTLLVSSIDMKESVQQIILNIVGEIYQGNNTPGAPSANKKPWWKVALNVLGAVVPWILKIFVFKRSKVSTIK